MIKYLQKLKILRSTKRHSCEKLSMIYQYQEKILISFAAAK